MKISLSVVIITYNEELNIRRCLESVKDAADEIVVVDSFSTDRTEQICREYGVKFITNKFNGHIEQKNFAITQASNPHILSLDADEALSDSLLRSILEVKADWTHDGYYFNRLTNYCGSWIRHGAWYPDRKLRLWDSRKGRWGGMNPHDRFEMDEGANISYLKGDLLHYSFYTIKQHIDQINFFTDIFAGELYAKGIKPNILHFIIRPKFKFIRDYFLRAGFLDGFAGFSIAVLSGYAVFIKYVKLYFLYKKNPE